MWGQEVPHTVVEVSSPLQCNAMHLTAVSSLCGRSVKLAAQYRTPACNQHRPQSSIYQCPTQLLSPPLGINKCASSPANKSSGPSPLPKIVNVRSCSVRFTMQSDNGFEKVFTAILAVETISAKICQTGQKKGDRGVKARSSKVWSIKKQWSRKRQ